MRRPSLHAWSGRKLQADAFQKPGHLPQPCPLQADTKGVIELNPGCTDSSGGVSVYLSTSGG